MSGKSGQDESDSIYMAEMVERIFVDMPVFGDRVVTMREGCRLQLMAERILGDARRRNKE